MVAFCLPYSRHQKFNHAQNRFILTSAQARIVYRKKSSHAPLLERQVRRNQASSRVPICLEHPGNHFGLGGSRSHILELVGLPRAQQLCSVVLYLAAVGEPPTNILDVAQKHVALAHHLLPKRGLRGPWRVVDSSSSRSSNTLDWHRGHGWIKHVPGLHRIHLAHIVLGARHIPMSRRKLLHKLVRAHRATKTVHSLYCVALFFFSNRQRTKGMYVGHLLFPV